MVVIRLTETLEYNKLKYMSRFIFAASAFVVLSGAAAAQQVPGRDLLEFPVGLLAEAPSISRTMAGGFWNPASASLKPGTRGEVGFAGLTTPQEEGIHLEMIAGAIRVKPTVTAAFSFVQASVSDVIRTEGDPQSLGEIPYGTSVLSAGLSTTRSALTVGAALRYRWATFDAERSHSLAVDAGAQLDRVGGTPVRLAASTFLFTPSRKAETPTYMLGLDAPILSRDSLFEARVGYSTSRTHGRGRDDYGFGTATFRQFDLSAGVSQTSVYGTVAQRLRLGVGVRYANYDVAIAREDGAAGFGGTYQFLITRVFR